MATAALAAVAILLTIGLPIAWILWQNHGYSTRYEQAFERLQDDLRNAPTGLEEKKVALADHPPGVVATVRIVHIIHTVTLEGMSRRNLNVLREVHAPTLWQDHHKERVVFEERHLASYEARAAQLAYADNFLGPSPSLQRIAALPNDPRYIDLGEATDRAVKRLTRSAKVLERSDPPLAGHLPWSVDTHLPDSFEGSRHVDETIDLAARCARAKLAGRKSPSEKCASLLAYVEPKPPCATAVGEYASPCLEAVVECPTILDPNAPTTAPDGAPIPPSYRSKSAPPSVC